jgi:nucleotide-binding universal stress UspA family protein
MFKTVLWATDGSAAAERALPVAKSIAQTYDGRLLVIHVSEIMLGPPLRVNEAQKRADATTEALQRKVEDLKREGVTAEFVSTEMTTRGAADAIVKFAREVGADLIVAGTRGNSPLARLLVGGVTRRLLELAPCPVLAVPPDQENSPS